MVGTALAFAILLASGDRPAATAQAPAPSPPQQPASPTPAEPVYTARGPRVNADAKVMADFEKRVRDYSALHRKLESSLPPLPKEATPQQIDNHQRALSQLLAKARVNARPGDIFTNEARELFRRYMKRAFAGPEGKQLRALVMDENPGRIRLTVNGRYPDSVPVVTVPPQVLQALPKLPDDLEYRFIGDTLVMLDAHAHVVVDLIDSAVPK